MLPLVQAWREPKPAKSSPAFCGSRSADPGLRSIPSVLPANGSKELMPRNRLAQIFRASERKTVMLGVASAHDNDGEVAELLVAAQGDEQVPSIHLSSKMNVE